MTYSPPRTKTYVISVFNFQTREFEPGVVVLAPPTLTVGFCRSHRTGLYTLTLLSDALKVRRQEVVVLPSLFRSRDIAGLAELTAPQLNRLGFDMRKSEAAAA